MPGRSGEPARGREAARRRAAQRLAAERLAAERADALQRLAGLEREFAGIIEAAALAAADDEHDPEGATIAYERQHAAALIEQIREHLGQIDAALLRLADGGYGICGGCGQPIAAGRLAARPAATTCIACAAR
jgi:DnaK suppressor protein